MKPVRTAYIGMAHDHALPTLQTLCRYPQYTNIVCITERDDAVRSKFTGNEACCGIEWTDEKELFSRDDIEAVYIESDELISLDYAEECIEKGWHVHMDKPAGTDIARFESILREAEKRGLVFHTGYMYRYNPAMRYLLDKVRSGELGELMSIEASMNVRHDTVKREWLSRFRGGMMFFLGCHLVDMVYSVAGVPEKVYCFNKRSGFESITSEDNCLSLFDYSWGTAVIRANAAEVNGYDRRHLVVCGTKGTIEIRPLERPTEMYETFISWADGHEWQDEKHEVFPGFLAGRYDDMVIEFARCVRGEISNPYPYAYEAQLQRLVLAASGYNLNLKSSF